MQTTFQRFLPLVKVDDEERMVYGYASTPQLDSDGEIIKVEAFEKALPEYMKFPTIREMHQPKAVGTTKNAELKKEGLYIGAKIVSDEAWKMVKEGVYRGFSIGGSVIQRVKNVITDLSLTEISLVDVPANKGAVVEIWKADKTSAIEKSTWTMAELSRIAMDLKYLCEVFEYQGKSTKEIDKVLETVKSLVATEAMEPEDDGSEKMKYAKALASILQKGGDNGMEENKTKVTETKTVVEETETVVDPASTDTTTTEATQTETVVEQEVVTPENKETGDLDVALAKVDSALKGDDLKKEDAQPKEDALNKSLLKVAETMQKMADKIVDLEKRLKTVEDTPAAPISKSVQVVKQIGDQTPTVSNPELEKKQKELNDLKKQRDELGAAEFARQGLSAKATRLQDEINSLIVRG